METTSAITLLTMNLKGADEGQPLLKTSFDLSTVCFLEDIHTEKVTFFT